MHISHILFCIPKIEMFGIETGWIVTMMTDQNFAIKLETKIQTCHDTANSTHLAIEPNSAITVFILESKPVPTGV